MGTKANCWLGDMLRGLSIGLPGKDHLMIELFIYSDQSHDLGLTDKTIAYLETTAIDNEVASWAM